MEQDEVRIPTEMEWALWKQSAEEGDAEAQYKLGRCYANGLGVEIDMVEAVRWFTLAAEQGDAMAQCALGNCYYYGYGVDHDCMKAIEWYVEAADRGLGKALCALGRTQCFDENLDKRYYNRNWFWFRGAADQGDAEGQWRLSQCCHPDSKEEIYWCKKAAEQGYYAAVEYLKEVEEMWKIKQREKDELQQAASQGEVLAMAELGERYEEGDGVQQDIAQAIRWYRLAAEHGDGDASERAEELEEHLEEIELWKLAAEQGDAMAMYRLGEAYDLGWYVRYDLDQAIHWYTLAAEQGFRMGDWRLEKLKCLMINDAEV